MPANAKSTSTHMRIKPEVKASALPILNQLHLSLGDYVNMALTALTIERGIPFELKLPPAGFTSWQDFENDVMEAQTAVANGAATIKNSAELRQALEEL